MTQNRNSHQMDYIEVAVRLRPLNRTEKVRDREGAWDIRVGEATSLAVMQRKSQMMIDETRRSLEVLGEGQGKVIMLKNKYRFGLVDATTDDADQKQSLSELSKQGRHNSVMKLHHSQSKRPYASQSTAAIYRSHSSFTKKDRQSIVTGIESNSKLKKEGQVDEVQLAYQTTARREKNQQLLETPTPRQDFFGYHATQQSQSGAGCPKPSDVSEFRLNPSPVLAQGETQDWPKQQKHQTSRPRSSMHPKVSEYHRNQSQGHLSKDYRSALFGRKAQKSQNDHLDETKKQLRSKSMLDNNDQKASKETLACHKNLQNVKAKLKVSTARNHEDLSRQRHSKSVQFTGLAFDSAGCYSARKATFRNDASTKRLKKVPPRRQQVCQTVEQERKRQDYQQQQHKFSFDLVYGERDTNRDVYEQTARKVVLSALDGVNGTIFVYGQTGTGKTYTMMGNENTFKNELQCARQNQQQELERQQSVSPTLNVPPANSNNSPGKVSMGSSIRFIEDKRHLYDAYENSGVLIFAMQDLFNRIEEQEAVQKNEPDKKHFFITLSYVEIYNESIYDLLVDNESMIGPKCLNLHEGRDKQFVIKGAKEVQVSRIQEVLELIQIGERNRHYAETQLNHCSSRSHTLFRLHLKTQQKSSTNSDALLLTNNFLNFVDLAGSEKITNYFGNANSAKQGQRLKEGLSINKSLFYLTQVIHNLSQKSSRHVPYRNSTLTKILKSSLSGNSRTSIVICITPAPSQVEQTLNSLKFGQKAMKVQQSASVQMNEMKAQALQRRRDNHNHLYFNKNSQAKQLFGESTIRDVINEYEEKMADLELKLYNKDKNEVFMLNERISELEYERERLTRALEIVSDRRFCTKLLYQSQNKGYQIVTMRFAGDVIIQTQESALSSIEKLIEERDERASEMRRSSTSCKQTVNQLMQELKLLKDENSELKEECDRLEQAYKEIIGEFSKMSAIQNEIIEMTQKKERQGVANLYELDLPFDDCTDREIGRLDVKLKTALSKINFEKEKRARQRRLSESMHSSSGGGMTARNFIRSSCNNKDFQNLINQESAGRQQQQVASYTQRSAQSQSPKSMVAARPTRASFQKNSSQKLEQSHFGMLEAVPNAPFEQRYQVQDQQNSRQFSQSDMRLLTDHGCDQQQADDFYDNTGQVQFSQQQTQEIQTSGQNVIPSLDGTFGHGKQSQSNNQKQLLGNGSHPYPYVPQNEKKKQQNQKMGVKQFNTSSYRYAKGQIAKASINKQSLYQSRRLSAQGKQQQQPKIVNAKSPSFQSKAEEDHSQHFQHPEQSFVPEKSETLISKLEYRSQPLTERYQSEFDIQEAEQPIPYNQLHSQYQQTIFSGSNLVSEDGGTVPSQNPPVNAGAPQQIFTDADQSAQQMMGQQHHHQWNMPQIEVIKEEVHNENIMSSFDNRSNSVGFDTSAKGAVRQLIPSMKSSMRNQIQKNVTAYNPQMAANSSHLSISQLELQVNTTPADSVAKKEKQIQQIHHQPNFNQDLRKRRQLLLKDSPVVNQEEAIGTETPSREMLEVQPECQQRIQFTQDGCHEEEQFMDKFELKSSSHGRSALAISLEKLSDLSQLKNEAQNFTQDDRENYKLQAAKMGPHFENAAADLINEDLMMEFRIDRQLAEHQQQIQRQIAEQAKIEELDFQLQSQENKKAIKVLNSSPEPTDKRLNKLRKMYVPQAAVLKKTQQSTLARRKNSRQSSQSLIRYKSVSKSQSALNSDQCNSVQHMKTADNEGKGEQGQVERQDERQGSKAPIRSKKTSPVALSTRRHLRQDTSQGQITNRNSSKASQRLQNKKQFKDALKSTRNDKHSFCTVIQQSSASMRSVAHWNNAEMSQNLRKPFVTNGTKSNSTSENIQPRAVAYVSKDGSELNPDGKGTEAPQDQIEAASPSNMHGQRNFLQNKEFKSNNSQKSARHQKKTKNLSIDLTDEQSPIIQQSRLPQGQNQVNMDALNQELFLDMMKSKGAQDQDNPGKESQKNEKVESQVMTPVGLTEILDEQLSDLTMIKSQQNLVSESQTSDQRNFTKFVRDATAAAKLNRLSCEVESRESNPMSMPSTVQQSKRTSPQHHNSQGINTGCFGNAEFFIDTIDHQNGAITDFQGGLSLKDIKQENRIQIQEVILCRKSNQTGTPQETLSQQNLSQSLRPSIDKKLEHLEQNRELLWENIQANKQLYQDLVTKNQNIELSSFNEDEVIQPITISEATSKSCADNEARQEIPTSQQKNKYYLQQVKNTKPDRNKDQRGHDGRAFRASSSKNVAKSKEKPSALAKSNIRKQEEQKSRELTKSLNQVKQWNQATDRVRDKKQVFSQKSVSSLKSRSSQKSAQKSTQQAYKSNHFRLRNVSHDSSTGRVKSGDRLHNFHNVSSKKMKQHCPTTSSQPKRKQTLLAQPAAERSTPPLSFNAMASAAVSQPRSGPQASTGQSDQQLLQTQMSSQALIKKILDQRIKHIESLMQSGNIKTKEQLLQMQQLQKQYQVVFQQEMERYKLDNQSQEQVPLNSNDVSRAPVQSSSHTEIQESSEPKSDMPASHGPREEIATKTPYEEQQMQHDNFTSQVDSSSNNQAISDLINGSDASTPAHLKQCQALTKSQSTSNAQMRCANSQSVNESNITSSYPQQTRTSSRCSKHSLQKPSTSATYRQQPSTAASRRTPLHPITMIATASQQQPHHSGGNSTASRQPNALGSGLHAGAAPSNGSSVLLKDLSPQMRRFEPVRSSYKAGKASPGVGGAAGMVVETTTMNRGVRMARQSQQQEQKDDQQMLLPATTQGHPKRRSAWSQQGIYN